MAQLVLMKYTSWKKIEIVPNERPSIDLGSDANAYELESDVV